MEIEKGNYMKLYIKRKRNETTIFILFKYLLQLTIYMLHILVDGDLLNSVLLI